VVFSPDNSTLAAVNDDNQLFEWQLSDGQLLRTVQGPESGHSPTVFSPDRSIIASVSGHVGEHAVILWRASDGKPLQTLRGSNDWIIGVFFSPDGRILATISDDDTIKLWLVSTGMLVRTLSRRNDVHKYGYTDIAFSPDGAVLASVSIIDQTINLWRVSDGSLLRSIDVFGGNEGRDYLTSLAFSPDDTILVSSSTDGIIRYWGVSG
jgi:WD40 repeat protein